MAIIKYRQRQIDKAIKEGTKIRCNGRTVLVFVILSLEYELHRELQFDKAHNPVGMHHGLTCSLERLQSVSCIFRYWAPSQ